MVEIRVKLKIFDRVKIKVRIDIKVKEIKVFKRVFGFRFLWESVRLKV